MKRKVWRSGNSWVITIPSEIVEKLNIMEKKLVDFDIKNVFEETEKIFDKMFRPIDKIKKNIEFREPVSDIKKSEKELIINLEIPGVEKKDIHLNVNENNLEIKVEKKSEINVKDEKKGLFKSERTYKGFYRSLTLPARVIPEKTKANYKNGILEVIMPRAEKAIEKKNKIEIK